MSLQVILGVMNDLIRYDLFVFALEEASRDMLPQLKDKALKVCLLDNSLVYDYY